MTGSPVAIGGAVATDTSVSFAAISASADGTIAVRPPPAPILAFTASNVFNAELHQADRRGARTRVGAARLFSNFMAVSPAGGRILAAPILDPRAGTHDLSLIDLSTDTMEPLTTTRGWTGNPVWSADGSGWPIPTQFPPGAMRTCTSRTLPLG